MDKAISSPLLWTHVVLLKAEAIQNGSGFGFNAYDEKGKPKWDLVQNVVIRHVEVKFVFSTHVYKLLFTDYAFCGSPPFYEGRTRCPLCAFPLFRASNLFRNRFPNKGRSTVFYSTALKSTRSHCVNKNVSWGSYLHISCSNISVWNEYESCIRQLEHTNYSLAATRLLHETKTQQGMNLNIPYCCPGYVRNSRNRSSTSMHLRSEGVLCWA